ncbi:uncharacterized protein [Physcomitrium patens]|uniref:Uncharacterized protein n=2 Tax=Physcomitrium patens TaxID=3218 RepID=A0A7I4FDP6_PHYPA|nr:uncharacterized protein LOC112274468 [Physcomitrium patens]|eukprot:XP_024359779.1 uncharacterized protein LOC112274468 [Physcomitrella patens]
MKVCKGMRKFLKDSYASTYAANNVKRAFDKLMKVLFSPEQERKLVIEQAGKKDHQANPLKLSLVTPFNTPLQIRTTATLFEFPQYFDLYKFEFTQQSSAKQAVKTKMSSCGGSLALGGSDSGCYIPLVEHTHMWKRSLRDYPTVEKSRHHKFP